MDFVVLGTPSRTGRKPILGTEENNTSDGASTPGFWYMASTNSVREIWYYRRDTLAKAVSSNELSVWFVTEGRGQFVLQRDPPVLNAILATRSEVRGR